MFGIHKQKKTKIVPHHIKYTMRLLNAILHIMYHEYIRKGASCIGNAFSKLSCKEDWILILVFACFFVFLEKFLLNIARNELVAGEFH